MPNKKECRIIISNDKIICSNCRKPLESYDKTFWIGHLNKLWDMPFDECPNCGAKVVQK